MEKPFPDPNQSIRIIAEDLTGHAPATFLSSGLEKASGDRGLRGQAG